MIRGEDPHERFAPGMFLAAALALAGATPAAAGTPEMAVETGGLSAGDGDGGDTEWAHLRLSWGDRLLLRAELPWLRYEGTGTASPPGIGPVVPERRTRERRSNGDPRLPSGGRGTGVETPPAAVESTPERRHESGLGDLRLAASYRLAGGGARLFRLDAGVSVKLPTADESRGLGTGEFDGRVGLSGEVRFWSLTLFGGAGYNILGDPPGVDYADVPDAYAGLESLPLADRVLISGWIEGSSEIVEGAGARLAAGLALRTLGKVRFEIEATAGLSDAAEDYSVSVGVSFGLRPPVAGPTGVRR
jgi:hypothetical protein